VFDLEPEHIGIEPHKRVRGKLTLERWNARTGKVVTSYDAQWLLRVEALSISPDGKRVAVAGWRSVIAVWEV